MKKTLQTDLFIYFHPLFPFQSKIVSRKKYFITIGIGGNIGNTTQIFKKLFLMLQNDGRFSVLETSPILKNPPFGYLDQNDFFNALILLKTNLSPSESLKVFQRYEERFKRKRTFQDAPRTLDIDIIFFHNKKIKTKNLTIPHKGYKERQSVQIPLKYLKKLKNIKV